MSILDKLKRGSDELPPRVILAGPEGIGKTTFGAHAPDPLFIAQENGLTGMDHVAHLEPADFGETLALVDELIAAPKIEFKTLVIDTADWLERSIHRFICKRDNKTDVEAYGYGKGYKIAEVELVTLLTKLDALRASKRVGIIILSHVHIKAFASPSGETWDRYEMKGHKGFTGILREWPDACLFAVHEVFKTKERGERDKVISGGRVIHTQWSPGWDAKNRLHLPEVLQMPEENPYETFAQAVVENSPANLRARFLSLVKTADFEEAERAKWAKAPLEKMTNEKIREGIEKLEAKQKK